MYDSNHFYTKKKKNIVRVVKWLVFLYPFLNGSYFKIKNLVFKLF